MNLHVIRAIFRRNFISYFSNPTGYVFICVFVLLSSVAAFWPNEFFNSNLANLDQLNKSLPYILLVFIPAITMSIWADERRQGTDELLLTIPAGDFDVVLGKYLAAVAIYTASLMFSLVSNWWVLWWLGEPDIGLFFATYFGYWIVGLAMLAIGMVASFLTGNLTVGFVLGAIFNAPLAFAASANVIVKSADWATALDRWSISHQFRDFSRGVISLSSVAYFLGIVVLMLYLCMVLIGRRHWRGGSEGQSVAMHYLVRFLALLVVVVSIDVFLSHHDRLRADVTSEGLSSLSPQSLKLLKKLDPKSPIKVYAYISNDVPESYVQTKLNLISMLSELKAAAGNKIELYPRYLNPLDKEATVAEQQFGIRPQPVEARVRGARAPEEIFLAVAVTCGLDKVVVPFFGKGLPVEYELIRSIATVSDPKRKKVGVLTTDAKLYGGFDMQSMSQTRNEMIVDELQKQFDVVQVDPSHPIKDRYDVLLAVQPSSLGPEQMEFFVEAVKNGQPTAIFEDPMPFLAGEVPGTEAPKRPPGGMNPFMMNQQRPQPKGDIGKLWHMLGIDFDGGDIVWQDYNPYPEIRAHMPREWVFIEEGVMPEAFNEADPISAGLQELLFPYPGSMRGLNASNLKFSALVSTGGETGIVRCNELMEQSPFGARLNPNAFHRPTGDRYILAARISGKLKTENMEMSDESPDEGEEHAEESAEHTSQDNKNAKSTKSEATTKPIPSEIDVVVVGDIDCLYSAFFQLRARGSEEGDDVEWRFENVTFVLNVLDSLAGDDRFIEIRKHRPIHRTLTKVAAETEPLLKDAEEMQQKFIKKFDDEKNKAQSDFDAQIAALKNKSDMDPQQLRMAIAVARQNGEQKLTRKVEELQKDRDKKIKSAQRELAQTIQKVQDRYKLWGVLLPPIFPLGVAFFVYFNRRAREREGVSKTRLRS